MEMVRNPFLLTLALEVLPSIVEGKTDLTRPRVTCIELYDTFVRHWLSVNKRRLQDKKLSDSAWKALDELPEGGFEQNGVLFQKDLAAAIFRGQDVRPIVFYSNRRNKMSWKEDFFSSEPDTILLRESSLLSRAGSQYRFVHRSVLEYFISCTIWDLTRNDDEFAPQFYLDSTGDNLSINDHPLSRRSLVPEPSIIQFLSERVSAHPPFKQHLIALVELSKSNPEASQAAANAITILVRAEVQFNGTDLRGICIPGADLTDGQFDSAHLQGSDLTGVNLTKAWIRQTDFSGARMEGTQFGELPYLQEVDRALTCASSSDEKWLAVGHRSGEIGVYDTTTWTKSRTLEGHEREVADLTYSPTGQQLLSGS